MQFGKKYCLNVSSYKYKRECMKLFSSTLRPLSTFNNNTIIESENLCPGGRHCKNYGIILSLEQKIKALNDTVNQLSKIKEYSESNVNRNITPPNKNIERKRDSYNNEFCNSFRNSIKKKKLTENHRNLTGNITLPQTNEPYRIKPYNSISNESKIPFKKISNKKHINLNLNNIRNYKNKINYNQSDINEQYFMNKNKKENENENNIKIYNKDKLDEDKKVDNKNKNLKQYSSLPEIHKDGKENFKNVKINNNNLDNFIYEEIKNNKINEEEKKNENKDNINKNLNIKNIQKDIVDIIKDNNKKLDNNENNKKNNNKKEEKKNNNDIIFPNIKKVKAYKLIEPLKINKNRRYALDYFENKKNYKDENKLYFRKFKGKIRNSLGSTNNTFLSKSFGFYNNTEGNGNLFDSRNHNSKSLTEQNRFNKILINSFKNIRPLSFTQKPFKVKININQNQMVINKNKFNYEIKSAKETSNNLSNSFELKKFINELEIENEEENIEKNKIFNEIYNLAYSKSDILIEKLKSISKEKIDKYCSFIKYCLNYLKDSINLINKFKIFLNLINKSKNKKENNYQEKKELLLNEEFIEYKKDAIKLLNCEDIHIYIYDSTLNCLILKGEKKELKFQKDKDLIGLCFSSGKYINYEVGNNSPTSSLPLILENNLLNKKNNLLIYPLKDKYDNIYGVIEVVNKIQDNTNKTSLNKNDEMIISLISRELGNFCKYYNIINLKNSYLSYYHELFIFWQKLFLHNDIDKKNNLFYMINEVIEISKIIFEMNDIQFLLCKKENFYDIQNNCNAPFEGLVYKSYIEKKIIYTYNPLIDNDYSSKSDLTINILNMNKKEEIITIPIKEIINNDVIMVLQIKTNKKLGSNYNNNLLLIDNYKLTDENYFIIEKISFMLQKYLSDNKELIQKL